MSEFISKINDHGKDYIIRDAAAAPIESPNLRGVPTAPTAAQETKNDQIATTAFVHGLINNNIDSKLGNPGGIATLDENGNIPSSQLPSYVDDVLDGTYDKENDKFLKLNGEIYSPESSKIYIDVNTRVTYRWTGTTYAEIASSLALGTTAATAFPGNRGLALEQEVAALSLGAMTYRGTIGIDGDVTELPSTHKKGDVYLMTSDGDYAGKTCKKDDLLLCVRSNTVSVATLPRPDIETYIVYQVYNPTDNTYGDIHSCHFWKSVYSEGGNFYFDYNSTWGYNQLEADYASRLYKTSNNGVSWTEYKYNERRTSIFAEPPGTTFKFLYSTVDIRDKNENVIFSANPFSLEGYNEDWTVIQGNLEDIVGEGAIYIDPDETSSEVESVDSVTSAKYVSYSNADSELEATNVQEAIDKTNEKTDDINTYLQRNSSSKNLLKPTIASHTYGGVTITVNSDKSITLNGTTTGGGLVTIGQVQLEADTEYIYSVNPSKNMPDGWFSQVTHRDGQSFVNVSTYGEDITFTNAGAALKSFIYFHLGVSGTVYDNITFYPMIRLSSIEGDTYQPYYEDTMSSVNYLNDEVNYLSNKLSTVSTSVNSLKYNGLERTDVVDNLLSTATDKPLSAKQGYVLNQRIGDHLIYCWEHAFTGSTTDPTDIYIRHYGSSGSIFLQGLVHGGYNGGKMSASVFGSTQTNSYFGGGYVIPLITNAFSVECITNNRLILLRIRVTSGGNLCVMANRNFEYYIGDNPWSSEAIWTLVN